MATLRLDIEDNEILELFGIQSNWPEHRLVWTLNRLLEVHLERKDDFILKDDQVRGNDTLFSTATKSEFSVFECNSEDERLILVANLGQGKALYDKGRPFDFLLKLESNRLSHEECLEILSAERGILAIAMISCEYDELAAQPFSEFE